MVLYETADGEYLGFYREYGGTVEITGYRSVVVREWVVKERPVQVLQDDQYKDVDVWVDESSTEEWVLIPEHVEIETRTIEGHWEYWTVWIEGHFEPRRYWIEENCEYELKTEMRPILGELVSVTRKVLVCEPAHWGERQQWIAGWYKEMSEWIDEYEEKYEVMVRTQHEKRIVVTPGHYVTKTVLVPGEYETVMVESGAWEEVPYQEPIYSYVGANDEYCLEELKKAHRDPAIGEPAADELLLRKTGTNEWETVDADFVSVAKSIGPNDYVA